MTPQKQTPTTVVTVAGASKFHKAKQSLSAFLQSFNAVVFAPLHSVAEALALVVVLIVLGVTR